MYGRSVTFKHVDKVFSFGGYVGINRACFASGEECVVGKSIQNVRTGRKGTYRSFCHSEKSGSNVHGCLSLLLKTVINNISRAK